MEENNSCRIPRWTLLKTQLNNLSPAQFKAKIEEANVIIVDVRTAKEFAEWHIKDAIHIDYFEEQFWDKIKKLDKSKNVLVYCRSGRRSVRVCTLMKNGGFDNNRVFNLESGVVATDRMEYFSAGEKN